MNYMKLWSELTLKMMQPYILAVRFPSSRLRRGNQCYSDQGSAAGAGYSPPNYGPARP